MGVGKIIHKKIVEGIRLHMYIYFIYYSVCVLLNLQYQSEKRQFKIVKHHSAYEDFDVWRRGWRGVYECKPRKDGRSHALGIEAFETFVAVQTY